MTKSNQLRLALVALAAVPVCGSSLATETDRSTNALNLGPAIELLRPDKVQPVKRLSGRYGATSQQVCLRTIPTTPGTVQIEPNSMLNVPAEIVTGGGSGTATFRPDGTFTIDGPSSTVNELQNSKIKPGDVPFTRGLHPGCEGTYSIAANNRIRVDWACKITVDGRPGLVIEVAPFNWDGFVVDNGREIDLTQMGTTQVATFKQNGQVVGEAQRLCVQSFQFHKLPD